MDKIYENAHEEFFEDGHTVVIKKKPNNGATIPNQPENKSTNEEYEKKYNWGQWWADKMNGKYPEEWEKELNKFYGLMFECGDYEKLVEFIRQEKQISEQKGYQLRGEEVKEWIESKKEKGYEANTIINDLLSIISF